MAQIIDKSYSRTDIFEIVSEFPEGYVVWNIGRQNFKYERYIPLAKPNPNLEFHILLDELKALEVESEELALNIINEAQHRTVEKDLFENIVTNYKRS